MSRSSRYLTTRNSRQVWRTNVGVDRRLPWGMVGTIDLLYNRSLDQLDLVDAMVMAVDERVSDEVLDTVERSACPTCGSCSGMFTANSMNCLTEALGLSLPGNGSTLATHAERKRPGEVSSLHGWSPCV